MNLTGQPIHQKPAKSPHDPKRLAAIRELPCCICQEFSEYQRSPTTAHHCIHGRYGNRRTPDSMAIPLCCGHHQGDFDTSKVALHREPELWKELYGMDTDWISWTERMLGETE